MEKQSSRSFSQLGKACALYPALEKKFGRPVKLAGYEIEKCLGRGEQGEGWKIKGEPYILKVLYESDERALETSKKACTFAKHMSKRDPKHFIECLKVGVEELDMKASDPVLSNTYTYRPDCNLCPGAAVKSAVIAGENNGKPYTCKEVQDFVITRHLEVLGGCDSARKEYQGKCCDAGGDLTYDADELIPKVALHYSVDGLASGKELRDLMTPGASKLYPKLRDALKMLIELFEVAKTMMTPTDQDPSQFYYLDLHFGNVMVTEDRKITMIDYGATYMCCNHLYPGALDKCSDLPECDPKEIENYEHLTNSFLFFGLLEVLIGRNFDILAEPWASDFFDYWSLPWNSVGLMGPARKNVTDLTPARKVAETFPPVKESYLADWNSLGNVATDLISTGLLEMASDKRVPWPPRWYRELKLAVEKLE